MPVCFATRKFRRKQETEFCFTLCTDYPQRPVLVVSSEPWRAGSAFADDIADLAFAKDRRVHPCFDCDGVAVRKVEVAVVPVSGTDK